MKPVDMRRHEALEKFHDDLVLTIEAAIGIMDGRPKVLPAEVLWTFLARDLLHRIDRAVPRRESSPSPDHPLPSDSDERDVAAGIYENHGFIS